MMGLRAVFEDLQVLLRIIGRTSKMTGALASGKIALKLVVCAGLTCKGPLDIVPIELWAFFALGVKHARYCACDWSGGYC